MLHVQYNKNNKLLHHISSNLREKVLLTIGFVVFCMLFLRIYFCAISNTINPIKHFCKVSLAFFITLMELFNFGV